MGLTTNTALRFCDALDAECRRTVKHLKVPGYPRIYYLSYLLRDIHTTQIWGRLGSINQVIDQDSRNLLCDCRLGSYAFDQVREGGLDDNDTEAESYEHVDMPVGNDIDALKYHVWRLTDSRFREAVRDYLGKKSHHITYRDSNRGLPSFVKAAPRTELQLSCPKPVDVPFWRRFVEKSSRVVKDHPAVKSSSVELRVRDTSRVFVSSEGHRLVDHGRTCELCCELWLMADSGEGLTARVIHVAPGLDDLPDLRTFNRQIRERIALLEALAKAPSLKSYAGPVLLAPGPAGILLHEVLGHRLEGSRLLSTKEGQTFKRDVGKTILPPLLSLYDDPTLSTIGGVPTVGSYRFDDEGSPARRADLVDRGTLIGFLSGRSPVLPKLTSNGHARSEYHERATSRMANLVIEAEGGLPHHTLKARFIEEIRRQGLPYGVMILDAEGGETSTEAYDFQAFMGSISVAVQVWADGRENLIRNVNFVGTPLTALRTVIAAGDRPVTQNAFCGAESGVLPVSTTCPALLLANLELQAADQRKYLPYVLPMPHEPGADQPRAATSRSRR